MNLINKFIFNRIFLFMLLASLLLGLGIENLLSSYSALPLFYILAASLLLCLCIEALSKKNQIWSLPSLIIYITIVIWYLVEIIYWSPENYLNKFSYEILELGYSQIIIFLVAFRIFVPSITKKFIAKKPLTYKVFSASLINPSRLLAYFSIMWLGLLLFGISRLNGDIFGALFPIKARAGVEMWQRGAAASAGSSGFIVSSAAYVYLLVCSFFGILLPLQKRHILRFINISLILISWPYFILMGTRKYVLAVVFPSLFSYFLLSRHKWWIKILILGALLFVLNYGLSIIIAYRNVGFTDFFNTLRQDESLLQPEQKHLGLNMGEELFFINSFYKQGTLQLKYGAGYIIELLNFIPRAIWPDKPFINIDYSLLRGFGREGSDIGVFATISPGCIGQGVMNFGPYLGPLAPALLLALWAAFLARLWSQRYSIPRLCLFLTGLGVTFNLGRGISLLSLWPIVFGYAFVRIFEHLNEKKVQARGGFS